MYFERVSVAMLAVLVTLVAFFWLSQHANPGVMVVIRDPIPASADGETPGVKPVAPPPGWIRIDAGKAFSFFAPRGTVYRPLDGIDSFVGEIAGPGFQMIFDYGAYSNDLSGVSTQPGYAEEILRIDGRKAVIRTALDMRPHGPFEARNRHFVGLYVPAARCRSRAATYGLYACTEVDRLSIEAAARSDADAVTVKQIFRTLTFAN